MESRSVAVPAKKENINSLIFFAEDFFTKADCPRKIITNFCIALDEAAANICSYAYPDSKCGNMELKCEYSALAGRYSVIISDRGVPFDPLGFPAADVSSKASERTVGGLGIHIVRTLMNEVSYTYKDGCNILKLTQKIK